MFVRKDPSLITWSTTLTQHSVTLLKLLEVKITGGDNRQYNLTTLTPYTNYTVTIRAYNDVGTGPANSKVIQQTGEAGMSVTTDI